MFMNIDRNLKFQNIQTKEVTDFYIQHWDTEINRYWQRFPIEQYWD